MQGFSDIPLKPDFPDTSERPEFTIEPLVEQEGWQDKIDLPEDTGGWIESIDQLKDINDWIDHIEEPKDTNDWVDHIEDTKDKEGWIGHIENPIDLGGWQDTIDLDKSTDNPSHIADSSENNAKDTNTLEKETYPSEKKLDGKLHYYDSQGNLYRIGDQLLPNNSYEINGYTYQTDDLGRIVSAEGKLHLKDDRDRLKIKDSMDAVGKGDQKESDDRGHLIGDQFDGSNGLENLVPQDSNINQVDFRKFENELAKEIRAGNDVCMKVEPMYDGNSNRPSSIVVTYIINDTENIRIFPND